MIDYSMPIALRWADFDPNFHLRHTAYYDFGATARLAFIQRGGLSYEQMQALHIGLILFREEAVFRREVLPGDELTINVRVTKLRSDASRFSLRHEIIRADRVVCAIISVDCAWIDTKIRKLAIPPPEVKAVFENLPKSEDFESV